MSEAMVRLKINDKVVEAPAGMNLIEAARLIGVEIPHFCYHPELCIAGNCRMCVVEAGTVRTSPTGAPVLEWSPKLTIACNTAVVEGMEVRTHTPRVVEARRGVMEFLLINHPLDCPICDQAGECRLQELAVDYGRAESRFVEAKEKKPKRTPLGAKIMLDDERCILCSRCVRFMRDVVKQDCLGFVNRGSGSTLTCCPGHEPASNYDLNCVDLCPVGALTSVDFRFRQRVWFLKQTRSICPHCSTGCNIVISSREESVYRLTPRDNEAVNGTWMCDEGRLDYRFINDARRLTAPLVRTGGGPATTVVWTDVIPDVAKRLMTIRDRLAGGIAFIGSASATTEESFLFSRLADTLKGTVTDVVPHNGKADDLLLRADHTPNMQGTRMTGVAATPPGSRLHEIAEGIRDGRIQALVVMGEDVTTAGLDVGLLARLELLVVIGMLPNAVTDAAQVILPGASFAEKGGTFINHAGRLQRLYPAVASPGQARPEWRILSALLEQAGGKTFTSVGEVFGQMVMTFPALSGLALDMIGPQGVALNVE